MDIYEEIVRLRQAGRKGALATIVHTQGSIPSYQSSKLLVRDDGSFAGTVGGGCVEAEFWAAAQEVMREERPRKLTFNLNSDPRYDAGLTCGGTLEIYVEPILPPPVCYLFGGGPVSLAVARLAGAAGFGVVVVDDRPRFANRERFPEAAAVYADEWEKVFPQLAVNEPSYLVIVTPARYVGLIGSKRKVIEIYKILESEGVPRETLERVHAPIGVEIGALTPEEIGVSIVAELIDVRRNVAVPGAKSLGRAAAEAALRKES